MASLPIDPAAGAASYERSRVPEHVVRNEVPDRIAAHRLKESIAERTPCQWSAERFPGRGSKDLLFLLVNAVACDEQAVSGERAGGKAGVPGKDRAILLQCPAEDRIVIRRGVVQHVEPEQAEAFRQPAQHGISDELHTASITREWGEEKQASTRIASMAGDHADQEGAVIVGRRSFRSVPGAILNAV